MKNCEEFFSNQKELLIRDYLLKSDGLIADEIKKISWIQRLFTGKKIRNLILYNIASTAGLSAPPLPAGFRVDFSMPIKTVECLPLRGTRKIIFTWVF